MNLLRENETRLKKLVILSSILIMGFFIQGPAIDSVYGHGCQAMMQFRDFRIEDETFNRISLFVGETLKIQGTLVSLTENQQYLKPSVLIVITDQSSFVDDIMKIFYGPSDGCMGGWHDGNPSWYFSIDSATPPEITLEPGDKVPFFITLSPLKAGTYHVHSAMLENGFYRIGPGQTIVVEGSNEITNGELFGFYVPFFSSIVLIPMGGIIGVVLLKRKLKNNSGSREEFP